MDIKIRNLLRDLSNTDDDLRALSVMTLFKLEYGDQETRKAVMEALITATQDKNVAVRFFARKAIDKIRKVEKLLGPGEGGETSIEERLNSQDYRERLTVAMEIKNNSLAEYKEELIRLVSSEEHNFVKASMISALAQFLKPEEYEVLIPFLSDSDSRVRSNAIEGLEQIKAQEAIPALFPALRDPDNRIRAAAAKALQSFGEEKTFLELKKMLNSPEEWMKASAIYALSHITAPQAIQMLLDTARGAQQGETKIKATIALANYYDQQVYAFLRGMEANEEGPFKEAAGRALKLIEEKFGAEPPEASILSELEEGAEAADGKGVTDGAKPDDIASVVTNFFRKGKDEAVELSNKAALNFSISDSKKEINEHLKSMGSAVFDMYQGGELELIELVSLGNEILKMNFFVQKYTEQEEKSQEKQETGLLAQLKNLFMPAVDEESKANAEHAKKFAKRRDDLLVKLGGLAAKKYESGEFKPEVLEASYLIYEKLQKRYQEQLKRAQ
jgi:hypothetical protein